MRQYTELIGCVCSNLILMAAVIVSFQDKETAIMLTGFAVCSFLSVICSAVCKKDEK